MTHSSHTSQIVAVAVFLWLVGQLSACGVQGPGGIDRFSGGEVVTVRGSADIQIVASSVARVASARAIPNGVSVGRGGVVVFTAVAEDAAGRFLAEIDFRWRMRDPLAGTISAAGVFIGGGVPGAYGEAIEVTAVQTTDDGELTATGRVSVIVTTGIIDASIASVTIFPSTAIVRPGERVVLRPGVLGSFGGLVQDIDLRWGVGDPDVGTIDQNGILTAGLKPGFYEHAVEVGVRRLTGSAPPVVGTASVRVLSPEEVRGGVRAVIGPSAVVGLPSERVSLVLFAFDFQGRAVPIEAVRWHVRDAGVGTIDDNGRLVLGETPGEYLASVRATGALTGSYAGRTVSADLDVLVQRPFVVALGPPGTGQVVPEVVRIRRGERASISLLYFDASGAPVTADDVAWVFDDSVVSVDAGGRVLAVGEPGVHEGAVSAQVPAVEGGSRRVLATVVILGPLVRVDAVPRVVSLEAGDLMQFTGIAYDAADNRLFDVAFAWELADKTPGSLTASGFYAAGDRLGSYPGGAVVTATQRQPR